MNLPPLAVDQAAIVIKGAFNPAIFSPAWLQHQGLVGDREVDAGAVEIISRDVSVFSLDWLRVQITPDALLLSTSVLEETERMRDAVIGVIEALPHTPIVALGMNRSVHFEVSDAEKWHSLGDWLIPKSDWQSIVRLPATKALSIIGLRPEDDQYGGSVTLQIEPSAQIEFGIYILVNDHYDLTELENPLASRADVRIPGAIAEPPPDAVRIATKILIDEWSLSRRRSDEIISKLGRFAQ